MTLKVAPMALGGKLFANLAMTTPLLPCDLATLPHMHLYFLLWILSLAL